MGSTMDEQETTVTWIRSDPKVRVYTSNPVDLRKFRKDSRATEIRGEDDWAEFTIPRTDFDPAKGFKSKRKPLTEVQREAAADRLKKAREAK